MITPIRVLLLLFVALGAGLASLWFDEHGQPKHVAWQAPAAIDPAVPTVTASATPSLTPPEQLLARPVFVPDRKPPPPPPPPKVEPPPDPMASVKLFGVIGGETAGIIAQIDGKVRRVMLEQNVGAWKLTGIDGRKVTFEREGKTRDLMLAYSPLGGAPELPVAAAPRPSAAGVRGAAPDPAGVAQRTQDELRERQRARAELRARAGMNAAP